MGHLLPALFRLLSCLRALKQRQVEPRPCPSGRPLRYALPPIEGDTSPLDGDDTFKQVLQDIQRSVSRDAGGPKPQRGLAADDVADEPWAYERNSTVD
ncbi:hypothetical protein HYQ46_005157 [Verticillium longisporum]|nr:hypothetical protein HYQ46_005157 [Verticillium longisporum]